MMQADNSSTQQSDTSVETQGTNNQKPEQNNPLAASIQAYKTFVPKNYYQIDSYVDVYDSYSTWRVAKILEATGEHIKVNFDGWAHKWDEVTTKNYIDFKHFKLTSYKIAPFKKMTPPYTGGNKGAIREFDFDSSKDYILRTIEKMNNLVNENFQINNPHYITQFLRGELYILLDSVLSINQPLKSSSDMKLISDLIENYLSMFIRYLEVLPSALKQYIEARAANQLILYLVDEKIALASCIPELFDTVSKIFGGNARVRVFQNNEFQIKPYNTPSAIKPKEKFSGGSYNMTINSINFFANQGGFDKIKELLLWEEKIAENNTTQVKKGNKESQNAKDSYRFPIVFLKWIINLISPTTNLFSSSFREKFTNDFKLAFFDRVEKLSARDLKDNESIQVLALIRDSCYIFFDLLGKEAYSLCEQAEVECAYNMLKSQYLERKIRALGEFKDFFDRMDPNVDPKTLGDKRRFKYWDNSKLKTWILQKKLLEYLLGENFHVETLRRSISIMKFLSAQNSFTQDHMDLLWKATFNAHEDTIRAIYETIVELSKDISVESLDYLFTKIKEIPTENYDEPTILLIKDFTINAQSTLAQSAPTSYFTKQLKKSSKFEYYGLKLLWDAIQDSSNMKNQYTQICFNSLATIIKSENFKSEREKYLKDCCENIKKGVSVPQSLLLSLHIFSSYSGSGMFVTNLDEIVAKYQKDYNLVDTVVLDFERYMKEMTSAYNGMISKNQNITDKASQIFVGRYSHSSNIDHRFLFLENIALQLKKGDFEVSHLKKLWGCLIKRAVTEVERNSFITFLTKSKESSSKGKSYIIGEGLMKNFFNNVLCDKDQMDNYKNLNPEVFRCYEKYFEILNEKEGNLEISKNYNKITRYESLIGLDVFWEILSNCINEKVIKDVKSLLVNVHLKITSSKIEDKISAWQNFITKVMQFLDSPQKNPIFTTNFISLLNMFVVSFDGIRYLGKDGPSNETLEFIVVEKKDERNKRVVNIPINGTLFLLRKKISESFEIPLYDFDIYIMQNSKITPEIEEDHPVQILAGSRDKDREKDILISIKNNNSPFTTLKDKFKATLINNQKIMDLLFDLLASDNPKIVKDIWELLSFLPVNKSVRQKIEKLTYENDGWSKVLDTSCTRKLLYCLQVLEEISKETESTNWNTEFINKGGFNYLLKIFLKSEEKNLCYLFDCKCESLLIKLICSFIHNFHPLIGMSADDYLKITKKNLAALALATQDDLIVDSLDLENMQNPSKEFVKSSFALIEECLVLNTKIATLIYDYPDLVKLIKNGLIETNHIPTRAEFAKGLQELVDVMNKVKLPDDAPHPNSYFLSFLFKNLLNYAFTHRDKCNQFFKVAEDIFTHSKEEDLVASGINFKDLVNNLAEHFLTLDSFETQHTDQDYLLQGLLEFLELMLKKRPQIRDELLLKSKNELVKELMHSCLFEIPTAVYVSFKIPPPKCKSPESRRAAFQLLQVFISGMNEITKQAIDYLYQPLLKNFWRGPNSQDWFIVPLTAERAKTGYVGLKNLGCTCYMNSLLQQFFMISDFRDTVLEIEDSQNAQQTPKHENLLYQLKLVFGALKLSQRQYYDPRLFCYSYKDYEGNPINVLEQMDVDEFFNNIMDKLEGIIKANKNAGIIKRVFGGVLSNELICKGCPHYSEREEPYLAIPLQVKNKKNIMESLQSFISGEMLEGDNAYLCEKCDKKVPTLRRVCIKKLPNVLILVLKRFEFNYDTMQKSKVNDYCEFPNKLDMQAYTQGYLKKKEPQKKDDNAATETEQQEPDYPPEYFEYSLRGVVIHLGTAESGHYYSLIKDKNAQWFEFNDTNVRYFDPKDLAQEAFGGEEKLNITNVGGNQKVIREKTRNAYLLFYERNKYFDENGKKIPSMLVSEENRETIGKIENMEAQLLEEIKEDNFKFQMTKLIFDKDYGDFVYQLVKNCESKDFTTPDPYLLKCCKYCTTFFLTVILRAHDRTRLPPFLKELKSIYKKSPELSRWLIECFSYQPIIKEFLVTCNVKDMKYFVVGLLKIALKNTYNTYFKAESYESFQSSVMIRFTDTVIKTILEEKENVKIIDRLFETLAVLAAVGDQIKIYMIKKKMVGRLIYYLFNEKLPANIYKEHTKEFIVETSLEKCELGEPTLSTGVKGSELVKSVTEMIDKKKEKIQMDNQKEDYNYLLHTITILVNRCFAPAEGESPVELDEDEKSLLLVKINVLRFCLVQATNKKARKSLSTMIATLAVNRDDFSKAVMDSLEKDLLDKDDTQLKSYLQTLEKLMLIHDDYQKNRVERGVNILINIIKENANYYRAEEICIDYLFKICSRNSLVLGKCFENKQFLKLIETWLRENSTPYQGLAAQTMKLFKRKNYTVNAQALQQNQSKFISKTQDRIAKLKRIAKNESDELASEYDSDEDFSEHQYQIGEKLDFLSTDNQWVQVIVIDNLDEMINLRLPNDKTHWIHFDTDLTGPHLKVLSHTKNNVDYYKASN